MKTLLPLLMFAGLFLVACEPLSEEERLERALDEVEDEVREENEDFYEDNKGGAPEEVLETRVQELLKTYAAEEFGKLDETMGYSFAGKKIYGHSDIVAQKLGLDYQKLSYVQYWSGTSGVSSLVKTMDSSAPGVEEIQTMLAEYDAITAYDSKYFESVLPAGLSEDEKAAATLKAFADLHRVFNVPYNEGYISAVQQTDMEQILADTNLNEEDLTVVFKNGLPELMGEAFPDSWDYKARFIELAAY